MAKKSWNPAEAERLGWRPPRQQAQVLLNIAKDLRRRAHIQRQYLNDGPNVGYDLDDIAYHLRRLAERIKAYHGK